jgi:hypothetical protein
MKQKKKYEKRLTLHPMEFEKAVQTLLKTRPPKKQNKEKK